MTTTPEFIEDTTPPVQMSGKAHDALLAHMRRWSGWDTARITFGRPAPESPWARTYIADKHFVINVDNLLLNPHRILRTVNPFRLRQEGVLTGAMLHEVGHARYSHWFPHSEEQARTKPLLHGDGEVPSDATVALARLMDEPRVEGLVVRDARDVGCVDLDWTMRAMAAHLMPTTRLMVADRDVALMQLISSWALRAGRQIALHHWKMEAYKAGKRMNQSAPEVPMWVAQFTALLTETVADHMIGAYPDDDGNAWTMKTQVVLNTLRNMAKCDDNTGSSMVDMARDVLSILFPETPPEDQPQAQSGCGSCSMPDADPETGDGSDEDGGEGGADEEGDDEGTSASESDDEGEGGTEAQSEGGEPGDGQAEGSGETSESEDEGEGEPSEGDPEPTQAEKHMAKALAALEEQSNTEAKTEQKIKVVESPAEADPTVRGAGGGSGEAIDGGWRKPTPAERDTARNASNFLRDVIDSTETTINSLSDSPAAQVDGAALAAWKAGGQQRSPHFFKRTRREVVPAPPVKIAVLVDVSQSMGILQKPSALLSWALANATIDLRNFAGRGVQVESCLIHWGSKARVIQPNGGTLPGLREVVCGENTRAMPEAFALVEDEMPGFFDPSDKPENRLLVQFTDWDLWGREWMVEPMRKAMAAGVSMLTIGPAGYYKRSDLPWLQGEILSSTLPGRSHEVVYNKMFPEAVWDEAAKMLR